MKRRTFISTTILGALSTNHVLATSPVAFTNSEQSEWLSSLLNATNAKQRKRYLLTDSALKTAYENTKQAWFSSGYEALGNDYFVCRNEELTLFPIALRHETLGQIDFAVLIFERNQKNEWEILQSLSGFNIEALAKSLPMLPANTDDLANYIFPTKASATINTKGYSTKNGNVSFDIRITENKAIVNVEIMVNNELVWNEKQASAHTLS
jgi:hypothetical protein